MSHKTLWKISVTTTPEAEDAVAELLNTILGLPASAYTDSETGVSTVTIYLQHKLGSGRKVRENISVGLERIKRCGLRIGPGRILMAKVRREDWAESWKRHFKPIRIGDALLIKPSWSKHKPRKGQAVVVLDPGLSFGTGQHPTTAFCLHQIVLVARNCQRRSVQSSAITDTILAPRGTSGERNEERGIPGRYAPPRPDPLLHAMEEREKNRLPISVGPIPANGPCFKPPSLLDLGTGSGILAIAAAKLGYSPVLAMDFDPESVRVARANARANRVLPKVKTRRRDVTKLPIRPGQRGQRFDLVCANLTSDLLIAQRRRIAAQLNRTGTLVLAGILRPEFAAVQKAYKALGLSLLSSHQEKEWCSGSFGFAGSRFFEQRQPDAGLIQ